MNLKLLNLSNAEYERDQYLIERAIAGDPYFQYEFARFYESKNDYERAFMWMERAALQQQPLACFAMGMYFLYGNCFVTIDIEKAKKHLHDAARRRLAHAQYQLGLVHYLHDQKPRKAISLLRKAAWQKHEKAIQALDNLQAIEGRFWYWRKRLLF